MRVIFLRKQFSPLKDYDRETLMRELRWFALAVKTLHSKVREAQEKLGVVEAPLRETVSELLKQIISNFTYENLKSKPAELSETAKDIAKDLAEQLEKLEELTVELDWPKELERLTDLILEITGIVEEFELRKDLLSKIPEELSSEEIEEIVDKIASQTE